MNYGSSLSSTLHMTSRRQTSRIKTSFKEDTMKDVAMTGSASDGHVSPAAPVMSQTRFCELSIGCVCMEIL